MIPPREQGDGLESRRRQKKIFCLIWIHREAMCLVAQINSDMKNVIGMTDPNVMFKEPEPLDHFRIEEPDNFKDFSTTRSAR